jgi:hypothetical protein
VGCFEGGLVVHLSLQFQICSSLAMYIFCGLWVLYGAFLSGGFASKKVKGRLALDVVSDGCV